MPKLYKTIAGCVALIFAATAMAQVPQRRGDQSRSYSERGMSSRPSPSPSPEPTRKGEPASNSGRDGSGYSSSRSSTSSSSNSTSLERQRQNARDIENKTRGNR